MMFACEWCKYCELRETPWGEDVYFCTLQNDTVEPRESCSCYNDDKE